MNNSRINYRCSGFIVLLAASVSFGADDVEQASMHHGIKAEPLSQPAPRYPRIEIVRDRQGWVQLSYVVTADGNVIDPVVESSSGSELFEKAAMRSVNRCTYKPATWDGVPVQQCHTQVMITFALEGMGTDVTRKSIRRSLPVNYPRRAS